MSIVRCDICDKTVGPRPKNCEKIVSLKCVGPAITTLPSDADRLAKSQADLAQARLRIQELEQRKTKGVDYCQCCGQQIIGHECGC